MPLAHRLRRLAEFVRPGDLPPLTLRAFPWREPGAPYHIVLPLDDSDGHGGYTRSHRFDVDGVPYRERGRGRSYDALVVARYALRMRAIHAARGPEAVAACTRGARAALLASGEATGAWGRGPAPVAMCTERPSALVQGVVLSALVRLCAPSREPGERRVLERALARMAAPLAAGGTCAALDGGPFLEEYPDAPPSHVLNGCVYALLGLWDLGDALDHDGAARLAVEVEGTLGRALSRFDAPLGWSRYALALGGGAPLASAHYHRLHVCALRLLHARTGESAFAERAARWERALGCWWARTPVAVAKSLEVAWTRDVRRVPLPGG